jgi:hypothetical protein
MRNSADVQQISVSWWPGDLRYGHAAFFAFAYPSVPDRRTRPFPAGRWDSQIGEYLLDWHDVRVAPDPRRVVVDFGRAVMRPAPCAAGPCVVGERRRNTAAGRVAGPRNRDGRPSGRGVGRTVSRSGWTLIVSRDYLTSSREANRHVQPAVIRCCVSWQRQTWPASGRTRPTHRRMRRSRCTRCWSDGSASPCSCLE